MLPLPSSQFRSLLPNSTLSGSETRPSSPIKFQCRLVRSFPRSPRHFKDYGRILLVVAGSSLPQPNAAFSFAAGSPACLSLTPHFPLLLDSACLILTPHSPLLLDPCGSPNSTEIRKYGNTDSISVFYPTCMRIIGSLRLH
jgi:hypothetical protein